MRYYPLLMHILIAVATLAGLTPAARAQSHTWIARNSGTWSNGANWLTPPGIPVSGTGTGLVFDQVGRLSYTAIDDIAGNFTIGSLNFNASSGIVAVDTNAGSSLTLDGGPSGATIFTGNAAEVHLRGTIALAGTTNFAGRGSGLLTFMGPVTIGGPLSFTGANTIVFNDSNMSLAGGNITFSGSGLSSVELPSSLGGMANRVTIDMGTPDFGLATLTLNRSSFTTTNGIVIRSGNLVFDENSPFGAATNTVIIQGGTIRSGGTTTVPNPVQLDGADLVIGGSLFSRELKFTNSVSAISGNPGLRVVSNGSVTFQNAVSYSGPTVVGSQLMSPFNNVATLKLTSGRAPDPLTNGTLSGTSSFTLNRGASLVIDNSNGVVADRVPVVPITLNGGDIRVDGGPGANNVNFGDVTFNGHSVISVRPYFAGGTVDVQFGALTRQGNATITFESTSGLSGTSLRFANPLAGISDPAGAGPMNTPVIPYATQSAATLVTPDGTGVRGLATDETAAIAAGAALVPFVNNRLTGTPAPIPTGATVRINSLSVSSQSQSLGGGAGSTLQIHSGAIAAGFGVTLSVPTIDFGSQAGYLHTKQGMNIESSIHGSGGFVIASPLNPGAFGLVTLKASNPFTGGLTLNGFPIVAYSRDDQLGSAGGPVNFGGGTLQFQPANPGGSILLNRPMNVGPAGGAIFAATGSSLTLDTTGLTGPGVLGLNGAIELVGTNTAPGGLQLMGGTLGVHGDANFGPGPFYATGGTLQLLSDAAPFAKPLGLSGALSIDTNGLNPTWAGPISVQLAGAFTPPALTKIGPGVLTLTTAQPLTGDVSVQQGGVTLTAAGALNNLSSLTANAGTTVRLDNSNMNSNRLAGQLSLRSAELIVQGNAAGTTTAIGPVAASGGSNVMTLMPSPSASLQVQSDSLGISGSLLIRGPNLGATGPNSTRLFLNQPAAFYRELIPQAVGDFDPVGSGSFLVRYDASRGVIPINPSTPTNVIQNTAPTNTPTNADVLVTSSVTRNSSNTIASLTFAAGGNLTAESPSASTLTLSSGGVFVRPGGAATVTGVLLTAPTNASLYFHTRSALTIPGLIAPSGGIYKDGPETLTFAGPIFTNPQSTAIAEGAIVVAQGTTLSGGGQVLVGNQTGSAATLGGGGTISGFVVVSPTGTISPGASPGTLTLQNGLLMNAGSRYLWELSQNTTSGASVNWDRIAVTGGALAVSGAKFVPSFIGTATVPNAADPFWQTTHTWGHVIAAGSIGSAGFTFDNSAWSSVGSFSTFIAVGGVSLLWTPVPEPVHVLLIAVAGLAVWRPMRRRPRGANRVL